MQTKFLIYIIIGVLVIAGVAGASWYFVTRQPAPSPKQPVQPVEVPKEIRAETTKWKEYKLEEISQDFKSPDFYDRRLIGIQDSGQRDVIVPSMKELIGWEETGFFPREVSFPPYSPKIFFVKHRAETAHSAGFFMLDVNILEFKKLTEVSPIYENYYNYLSVVSPDGFKIASLGGEELYLLKLLTDEVEFLVRVEPGEVFYPVKEIPDFRWVDDDTIQYPVFSAERIYDPPTEIRQISIKTKQIEKIQKVVKDKTANWKTYVNSFSIKYPPDWEVFENKLALATETNFYKSDYIQFNVRQGGYYKKDLGINLNQEEVIDGAKDWIKKYGTELKEENVALDNYPATKLSYKNPKTNLTLFEIYLEKERVIYTISAQTDSSQEEIYTPIFNQMLSTFRFLR